MAISKERASHVFPVGFNGHKGTVHRPHNVPYNGNSVLICAPIGRDGVWTYRALFLWAEHLAGQGYQVLRYDHRGEGDSLDVAEGSPAWNQWSAGVGEA